MRERRPHGGCRRRARRGQHWCSWLRQQLRGRCGRRRRRGRGRCEPSGNAAVLLVDLLHRLGLRDDRRELGVHRRLGSGKHVSRAHTEILAQHGSILREVGDCAAILLFLGGEAALVGLDLRGDRLLGARVAAAQALPFLPPHLLQQRKAAPRLDWLQLLVREAVLCSLGHQPPRIANRLRANDSAPVARLGLLGRVGDQGARVTRAGIRRHS
mmetsp:Transcript_31171/g.72499  ORF Transcript_31171/g.72499 Transcript_31171/m.72499 type:complete len:213 (+) Transcript_31171:293-931(+)